MAEDTCHSCLNLPLLPQVPLCLGMAIGSDVSGGRRFGVCLIGLVGLRTTAASADFLTAAEVHWTRATFGGFFLYLVNIRFTTWIGGRSSGFWSVGNAEGASSSSAVVKGLGTEGWAFGYTSFGPLFADFGVSTSFA